MQEGEVTEPIKFGTNYYILRRGSSVPKSFEEAKKELEVSARNRKAYTAASELAQKISDKLKEVKDVQKVAEEFAGQANSTAKDMVRETDYVKKDDDIPNIGVSAQFEEGIMPLETVNDVGEKIPVKDGFAVPMLLDKKDPRDAEFAEVKDKVTESYKLEQANAKIEQIAKDIAAAGTTSALAGAAQSKGLKSEEEKNYILGSPLGKGENAGTSEALDDAIYGLKAGEVSKTPIKVGDSWYVVGVTNRTEASTEEFAKQRDQLLEGMLSLKRGEVFQDYLAAVRLRMEGAKEIVVYKDVVAKLDAVQEVETPEGAN
jgi:peptidyl-prolyl cis-trans isomerase D